ncbi:MFS transporter [Mycolicibacterium lacusdiani]|uniref:MFS transporter n=1 Tax=Mycolicibacterium lacusdiani TaxID=2895283 RepID=UPI001F367841|nr:MFS transporter [Mycolicibacterium lacusdiani]
MPFTLNPLRARRADAVVDRWPGVVAAMAGIFAIVTSEILPIGLLLPIAAEFRLTAGVSGVMMTVPGLVAAVTAPLATAFTRSTDRRTMSLVWMGLLAASNLICALATDFWMILGARILVGIVIGGFWSIGPGLAGRLVQRSRVGRATSTIFLAVPLGSVLGVPLGTFIADVAGWRAAFVGLTVVSLAVLVALACTLPSLPAGGGTRLSAIAGSLRLRGIRTGLLVTFLVVMAHFATYTYVSAFLEGVTALDLGAISAVLLAYGVAGLAGNLLAGATIERHLRATFAVAAASIASGTLLLPVFGAHPAGALILLMLWGFGYGAVPVCSQTWLARASGGTGEVGSVLFTSSFQATISVGALVGGAVLDGASTVALMLIGGTVAVVAATLIVLSRTGARR